MKNAFTPPRAALVGAATLTALSLTFSAPAQAIVVNVPGFGLYNFSTVSGSSDENRSTLQSQPWFGNQTTATTFATALGGPTYGGLPYNDPVGPYFAYLIDDSDDQVSFAAFNTLTFNVELGSESTSLTRNYATATAVPFESDALPVVGAAAFMAGGLWWKKKRAGAKALDLSPTEPVKG